MSSRLAHVVSWWFILQIVLPFTAPLQTFELSDLLGTTTHHTTRPSPESTSTPTMADAASDLSTAAAVVLHAPARLRMLTATAVVCDGVARVPRASARSRPCASQRQQQSVLRL